MMPVGPGQTLSHYRLIEKIGQGGMGVVYRAYDERLRRDVALKLLSENLSGRADQRATILAEARAASALNHPGITTIYEVGEDGDQIFIVMELVVGKTVRAMLSEGSVGLRPLLRVGTQAAEALAAAHARGVVHRDIKPENIIVQADGRLKLLDFGIARLQTSETVTLSRQETLSAGLPDTRLAGTLAYMAPEQLRGEEVDARADLFSLGVVLYEMAVGRRPFYGPTVSALIAQILNDAPPALVATSAVVPQELSRIVHKLLEKQPDSRYQSAREVQVDLTNVARDLDLGAAGRPVGAHTVVGKRAVAVLPFQFLTPSPEDEYLSVALADSIINQLSASRNLLVRPTSTVLCYTQQAVDPLIAARALNVQVIVDGSIQKFGQRLRVHVQARNATDGTSLLSGKHDSDMADLFGLQDQIGAALARALGSLPRGEAPAPPTKNAAAYELFLRAVERLARFTRWDMRMSIDMLEDVTRLDARFPEAWARLGEACTWMGVTFEPSLQWQRRAERAVRRALALDPASAAAQCARGELLWTPAKRFQNRAALRALQRALELMPGYLPAQFKHGMILTHVGLLEDAKKTMAGLLAAHPDDCHALDTLGQIAFYEGDYSQAEEWFARALAVAPATFYASLDFPTAALYRGELDLAEERIRAAEQVVPGDPMLAALEALLSAKRGDKRKTERLLKRALKGGRPLLHVHHTQHHAAAAYAVIGKPAQAVALLRKAIAAGLPNYPLYRDEPHFRSLGSYPPFLKLMAGLKKEWSAYQREFSQP